VAPRVIGLTGGIGSGKSAVADAFRALGVEVVDADDVVHALCAPGNDGFRAIVAAFGDEVLGADGRLDRARMRERAFSDPAFRAALEAILHPLVAAHIDAAIARWRGAYGVVVAPLLLERGNLRKRIARVLVVDAPEEEQVRRAMRRGGLAEAEVRAIMATQLPRADRLARADDVIDNAGPQAALAARVAALDADYRAGRDPRSAIAAQ
jgi:dephospho-CoA kinase